MLELIIGLILLLVLVLVGLAAIAVVIAYASQIAYIDPLHDKDEDD